MPASL
jgi:hypothetical protein